MLEPEGTDEEDPVENPREYAGLLVPLPKADPPLPKVGGGDEGEVLPKVGPADGAGGVLVLLPKAGPSLPK